MFSDRQPSLLSYPTQRVEFIPIQNCVKKQNSEMFSKEDFEIKEAVFIEKPDLIIENSKSQEFNNNSQSRKVEYNEQILSKIKNFIQKLQLRSQNLRFFRLESEMKDKVLSYLLADKSISSTPLKVSTNKKPEHQLQTLLVFLIYSVQLFYLTLHLSFKTMNVNLQAVIFIGIINELFVLFNEIKRNFPILKNSQQRKKVLIKICSIHFVRCIYFIFQLVMVFLSLTVIFRQIFFLQLTLISILSIVFIRRIKKILQDQLIQFPQIIPELWFIRIFYVTFFYLHFATCMINIAKSTSHDVSPSQIQDNYIQTLGMTMSLITLCNYFQQQNDLQIIIVILIQLLSIISLGVLVNLLRVILKTQFKKVEFDCTVIKQLFDVLNENHVSQDLLKQISYRLQKRFVTEQQISNFKAADDFVEELPVNIKNDIKMQMIKQKLIQISIFKKLSPSTLNQISSVVKTVIFNQNENIIYQNQYDDSSLYIIILGGVSLYVNDFEIQKLKQNDIFGINGFLTGNRSLFGVKCFKPTTLYKLKQKDFLYILSQNQSDREIFCEIRDKLLFNSNQIQIKEVEFICKCCQEIHNFKNCPYLHVVLDKERVLKQNAFSKLQERKKYCRCLFIYQKFIAKKGKIYSPTLKNLLLIQQQIRGYQGVLFQFDRAFETLGNDNRQYQSRSNSDTSSVNDSITHRNDEVDNPYTQDRRQLDQNWLNFQTSGFGSGDSKALPIIAEQIEDPIYLQDRIISNQNIPNQQRVKAKSYTFKRLNMINSSQSPKFSESQLSRSRSNQDIEQQNQSQIQPVHLSPLKIKDIPLYKQSDAEESKYSLISSISAKPRTSLSSFLNVSQQKEKVSNNSIKYDCSQQVKTQSFNNTFPNLEQLDNQTQIFKTQENLTQFKSQQIEKYQYHLDIDQIKDTNYYMIHGNHKIIIWKAERYKNKNSRSQKLSQWGFDQLRMSAAETTAKLFQKVGKG